MGRLCLVVSMVKPYCGTRDTGTQDAETRESETRDAKTRDAETQMLCLCVPASCVSLRHYASRYPASLYPASASLYPDPESKRVTGYKTQDARSKMPEVCGTHETNYAKAQEKRDA